MGVCFLQKQLGTHVRSLSVSFRELAVLLGGVLQSRFCSLETMYIHQGTEIIFQKPNPVGALFTEPAYSRPFFVLFQNGRDLVSLHQLIRHSDGPSGSTWPFKEVCLKPFRGTLPFLSTHPRLSSTCCDKAAPLLHRHPRSGGWLFSLCR